MKEKSQSKVKKRENFTPHCVAIQRVKRSFERAKEKQQSNSPVEFVEVE
jgi:hypothetical protein